MRPCYHSPSTCRAGADADFADVTCASATRPCPTGSARCPSGFRLVRDASMQQRCARCQPSWSWVRESGTCAINRCPAGSSMRTADDSSSAYYCAPDGAEALVEDQVADLALC